ncbi:TonB-dependent receptor [Aliiglaciecola sp. 3_MG-2023]|uniref:TonB-dependent receptor n=1 Tax=Aliiglaciecola sp. 3_MG-2023 TaxID=3062644 RepID=UPI0026E33824|nr:TonB-dependent receptor [Aliiglaciecola sp. 3_MG-2023]MDO6694186.1 TonB-dependent receptor [Aliiglaciecola sp. 3_MG-2023]
MHSVTFRKHTIAKAIASALVLGSPVYHASAQQVANQEGKTIERIEVTASRRTQSIQEVPYNISAISGTELEDGQIVDSTELLRNIPGATIVDRGYRNSGVISGVVIRGINVNSGAQGDVPLSAVSTVAAYVNDTPLNANFILKDIEMVEVLRGPQGTLYGSGSLAGTVKYRMNKAETDEFYGSVGMSVGQTKGSEGNSINMDAMVNIPLSETLAFRANIGRIDNDGIVDYTNVYVLDADNYAPAAQGGDLATGGVSFRSVEDADTVDIDYGRMSLFWQPTDNLNINLSYQKQTDEIGGRRQVTRGTNWVDGTEQAYGDYQNGAVLLEPSERDVDLTALEAEWDLGFATLTSSSSKYNHEGSSTSDNTGFYAKQNWFADLYYGSPRPMALADRSYDDEAFVQELRLVSNQTVNNIDWVVGAYYMDQDSVATQDSYMPGYQEWAGAAFPWWPSMADFGMVYTDNDFHYVRTENFKDKALFGELTYHFSDDFRSTVGIRRFDNTFTNNTELLLPIWPFLGAQPNFETSESDTLFKLNMSYDLSQETMLYGTISEGYRRGGANAVPLNGSLAERPEWQQYDSDKAVNYEIGVKGYLDNRKHSYSLSAFVLDWDDPQLSTSSFWGFYTVTNGESARTQGIELELQGYLTDEIHYVLGYAYVNAELTADFIVPTGVSAENATRVQASDGTRLPASPEHTLSLALDYTYEMNNGMYWITQVNTYYQSDSLNYLGESQALQADIDGFSLWNLTSRISKDDWNVTFYIKNMFNEDGTTGTLPEAYMGTDPDENFLGNSSKDYISLPRTLGVAFNYRF